MKTTHKKKQRKTEIPDAHFTYARNWEKSHTLKIKSFTLILSCKKKTLQENHKPGHNATFVLAFSTYYT